MEINKEKQVDHLFFEKNEINEAELQKILKQTLQGMDDGEIFFESSFQESVSLKNRIVSESNFSSDLGFGFRGVVGEAVAFSASNEMNLNAIKKSAEMVASLKNSNETKKQKKIITKPHLLYGSFNPINEVDYVKKVEFLQKIDAYLRKKNPAVKQVSASIGTSWQAVKIMRIEESACDIRPLCVIRVYVQVEKNGRMEDGSFGYGGRKSLEHFMKEENWKRAADEALRVAILNLEAIPAPAGEMPVILGSGWPGVLLHEAVGHGLEGDFNRKGTSAFSGKIGQMVASKNVTVIDDGTIPERRGSLNVDDEGTPTQKNVLIENGVLKNYMQDRQNARLMNVAATGNGRRESFADLPMPRMTNTFMLSGEFSQEEIISSVKKGIFAVGFQGGQVDITSGNFVFSASEAYLVENGKVTAPVKGATLSGNGPKVMQKISMVGNDSKLDEGVGTCGKNGQSVPVGVGVPSLLVGGIVVGGTES